MTADVTIEPVKRRVKKHLQLVPGRNGEEAVGGLSAPVRPGLPTDGPERKRRVPGDRPKPLDRPRTIEPPSKGDAAKVGRTTKRRKYRAVLASFLAMVALPAVVAAMYFAILAADQFHAEARFAVRGTESVPSDIIGMITGTPSGAANSADSYMLQQYIGSREMVEVIDKQLDVAAIFNRPEADFFARLGEDKPIESIVDYWNTMVTAEFDPYSGIITLETRAFRAEDAQILAMAIVKESDAMVNRLSAKARADAISFAQKELEFAEWRLQDSRRSLVEFQNSENTLDPAVAAAANQQFVLALEGRLSDAKSQLASIVELAGPNSPSARVLQTQIAALVGQIDTERQKVAGADPAGAGTTETPGLTSKVADYQELKTAEEFAEQVYLATLKGLETARAEAKRTHSYLATFVTPMRPQDALYPKRIMDTILVIVVALGVWAVGGLLYAAARDHLA